jgi:hypothetical protein
VILTLLVFVFLSSAYLGYFRRCTIWDLYCGTVSATQFLVRVSKDQVFPLEVLQPRLDWVAAQALASPVFNSRALWIFPTGSFSKPSA